jgi:hypothetical protein
MKKTQLLTLVLAMVLAFSITAFAATPQGFVAGNVTKIDKKSFDSFVETKITPNNSTTNFSSYTVVADNKVMNSWYVNVTDPELKGTLIVAYKISSEYFLKSFRINGTGKYWIGDSRGSNGVNMVKIGKFIGDPPVANYATITYLPGSRAYDGKTGTGGTIDTVAIGSQYTIRTGDEAGIIMPTLPNGLLWTFTYWSKQYDGIGSERFYARNTITITENMTFYARYDIID